MNCCLIILILLLRQSVWMFFSIMQWSSHHWYASASDTPQWTRKNPQMDLVSMLNSKDTFVPCRNLIFGNRLSLIAIANATAFPLRAGFMPYSPMPRLDVSELLLLTMVSTSAGGSVLSPFLVFEFPVVVLGSVLLVALGLALPNLIANLGWLMLFVWMSCVVLCCVKMWRVSSFVLNLLSLVCLM